MATSFEVTRGAEPRAGAVSWCHRYGAMAMRSPRQRRVPTGPGGPVPNHDIRSVCGCDPSGIKRTLPLTLAATTGASHNSGETLLGVAGIRTGAASRTAGSHCRLAPMADMELSRKDVSIGGGSAWQVLNAVKGALPWLPRAAIADHRRPQCLVSLAARRGSFDGLRTSALALPTVVLLTQHLHRLVTLREK